MINELKEFLSGSFSTYHAVDNIKKLLEQNNFIQLKERTH